MKSMILLLTMLYVTVTTAQPLVAVDKGTSTEFYSTLDSAITYANVGDVIYIPGGVFALTVPLDKGISIFGVGHYPDSTMATNRSVVSTNIVIAAGAHNLYIDGLYIDGSVKFNAEERSDNVVIKRTNMASLDFSGSHFSQFSDDTLFSQNTLVEHCVIRNGVNLGFAKYPTLTANIVGGFVSYCFKGGVFANNIFLFNQAGTYMLEDIRDVTIRNNVFMATSGMGYAAYSCYNPPCGNYNNAFLNNAFASDSATVKIANGMAAVIQSTLYNVSPLFLSSITGSFDYNHNYHLQAGSPAKNAGSDGTDIGIYGGATPYRDGGVPPIPHIISSDVAPATDANGKLHIEIKVRTQDF